MKSHRAPDALQRARPLRRLALFAGVLMILYLAAFVCCFEILSCPVRNDSHGWLGPVMRGDMHSVDIGKVYYYEGTDFASYRVFQPLCKVWLLVQGLRE